MSGKIPDSANVASEAVIPSNSHTLFAIFGPARGQIYGKMVEKMRVLALVCKLKSKHPKDKSKHPADKSKHPADKSKHPTEKSKHPTDKSRHQTPKNSKK